MSPHRGMEIADESLLDRIRRRGYVIDQSVEVKEYLDRRGANAATFLNKDLLLRPNPRKIEVREEYLHNVQRIRGLTDRMSMPQLENHVKQFMVDHHTCLGISDSDTQWLLGWLTDAGN